MTTIDRLREIARVNAEAGFYYFNADTMRAFGDRLTDFDVLDHEGRVYIVRRGGWRNAPGHDYGEYVETRQIREARPDGSIGQPIHASEDPELWALAYPEDNDE